MYLAIAYLLRKLEKQVNDGEAFTHHVEGADGVQLPDGEQRKGDSDPQEPETEGQGGEVDMPASYGVALTVSHTTTAICLR